LRAVPISTAVEITERLVREADAFAAGAEQADDMTVVTIQLKRP
jgi:serine phosphatase RsbU (regulator of sigma subunit)